MARIVTITFPSDHTVRLNGRPTDVVRGGRFRLEIPSDYHAEEITQEDVLCDSAIRVVEDGAGPYSVEATDEGVWTVIYDSGADEVDLNAQGEPCATLDELEGFIRELHAQGAFDLEVRDALVEEVKTERELLVLG